MRKTNTTKTTQRWHFSVATLNLLNSILIHETILSDDAKKLFGIVVQNGNSLMTIRMKPFSAQSYCYYRFPRSRSNTQS